MDGGVEDEAGAVDGMAALDDAALVVGEDQVRHPNLREVDAHRVGPIELRPLRVADGEVAGEAVVKAVQGEGADRGDQVLLAVLALLGERGESRAFREDEARLFGLVEGDPLVDGVEHCASPLG